MDQIEQLQAQLEQKDNTINSQTEHIKTLAAFQQEAMAGREKIAALSKNNSGLEAQLGAATKLASDAKSAADSLAAKSGVAEKKLAAAEDIAKAIKVLLGL